MTAQLTSGPVTLRAMAKARMASWITAAGLIAGIVLGVALKSDRVGLGVFVAACLTRSYINELAEEPPPGEERLSATLPRLVWMAPLVAGSAFFVALYPGRDAYAALIGFGLLGVVVTRGWRRVERWRTALDAD